VSAVQLDERTASRFWRKVERGAPDACWSWTGTRHSKGYGSFSLHGRQVLAHRVAWQAVRGPIPSGLVVDHLCQQPLCQNPLHMALVTAGENVLRGRGPTAVNARRSHCPAGHVYDGRGWRGERRCLACQRAACRRWWRAHGAAWRRARVAKGPDSATAGYPGGAP
jgi:hypothetical protein